MTGSIGKRRVAGILAWSLPASALLTAAAPVTAQPALPTGGTVVAGAATIGAPVGPSLAVTQSSNKAIIEWNAFSIGAGGNVRFDNGTGTTLNRVTGASVSSIDGVLSASGSVYLINPNGVVIGTSGVVDVGGSFVTSTLDLPNGNFLSGGDLTFTGGSNASVVNLGRVGSLGGDVVLIAARVENDGAISAANGTAGLLSGYSIILRDAALDQGRFSVRPGGSATSATNSGTIAAASAELRAAQGNVYALAGNTAGVIRATGVKSGDGKIWLVAAQGTVDVAGTLDARGSNGAGGTIETSGETVRVGQAAIDTHGGSWTLDPTNLEITPVAATTISGALASSDVTQRTSASGASDSAGSGAPTASGAGDIIVDPGASILWSTGHTLELSAYHDIIIGTGASIASTGGATINLRADNMGTGSGTVTFKGSGGEIGASGPVNLYYNPANYSSPASYASHVTGPGQLTAYMLVNSAADLTQMSNGVNSGDGRRSSAYALGRDIYNPSAPPIGSANSPFAGIFDGQGHSIYNLTVRNSYYLPGAGCTFLCGFYGYALSYPHLGLFGYVASPGIIRNVNLVGGSVTDSYVSGTVQGQATATAVGALVGANFGGTITNVTSSVTVYGFGDQYLGGLVGLNAFGTISNAYVSGLIVGDAAYPSTGYNGTQVQIYTGATGGLVGQNNATVINSYFTGSVVGSKSSNTGGFVGVNTGAITNAYVDGSVSGVATVGGFAGSNTTGAASLKGVITNAYWDVAATGLANGIGVNTATVNSLTAIGGTSGISPYAQATYAGFDFTPSGAWFSIDGSTRPFLRSEYSTGISNAHQLQLIALNPSASYTLGADIDASDTNGASPASMWTTAGFVPVGGSSSFAGTLDGGGHIISSLTIRDTSDNLVGLFSRIDAFGVVRNLGLVGATVSGAGAATVGALAGFSAGTLTNVFATGSVRGPTGTIGGLVGVNAGDVTNAYAAGTVAGGGSDAGWAGGLVGANTGRLTNVYATASVLGGRAGGLVGGNSGVVTGAYATGAVSGISEAGGGLVGTKQGGTVTAAYYDTQTTGQASDPAGAVGLTTAQFANTTNLAGFSFGGLGSGATWVLVDQDGTVNNANGAAGGTRPMLLAEYATAIRTAHQLQLIALDPTAAYTLASNVDAGGTAAASDVWLAPAGFVPIGQTVARQFSGSLDGQSHTIAGLTINRPAASDVGLFAIVGDKATIKAVALGGGSVTGYDNVGALVGQNAGSLANDSSSVTVTGLHYTAGGLAGYSSGTITSAEGAGTVQAGAFVGGVVGYNAGTVSGASASDMVTGGTYVGGLAGYSDVGTTLSGSTSGTVAGMDYAGGIAGFSGGTINGASSSATVSASNRGAGGLVAYNTGTFRGSASGAVSGKSLLGGLVGVNFGTINYSSATGSVSGVDQVGGLAGANVGTVLNSSATGAVTGLTTTGGLIGYNLGPVSGSNATGQVSGGAFTGGLVGYNGYNGGLSASGAISGAYATGPVTGSIYVGGLVGYNDTNTSIANSGGSNPVSGVAYAGGIAGYNGGTISYSNSGSAVVASERGAAGLVGYNTGSIVGAYAYGPVTAPQLAGGLIGVNFGTASASFASGTVSGSYQVGGLVGANAGRLSQDYAIGAVSGANQVGGLLGYNEGNVADVYATGAVTTSGEAASAGGLVGYNAQAGQIARAYTAGAVSQSGGGIAGTNAGTLVNTAFDTGTTRAGTGAAVGASTGTIAIGGATGKDPYAPASYAGFDFLRVWTFKQGQSRPYLQSASQNPLPQ